MDEFNPRRSNQDIDRRVLLVLVSGILLSLFIFTLALAKRPGASFNQGKSPTLNISKNLGFTVLKGTPGSNSGAPISAPISNSQDCTNTVRYWLDKPGDWPTNNLVVGRFTFQKASILEIFQTEEQDEVSRVQQQFLAAALNILQGANPGKIETVMAESSAWLNDHPPKIELTGEEKAHGADLADRLADFNRGLAGPGACPGNTTEPASIALQPPILLPSSPVLGSTNNALSDIGGQDLEKQESPPGREGQSEDASPSSPAVEPGSSIVPTILPPMEVLPAPEPSQPAYSPPPLQLVASEKESKKPKEKKNPKGPFIDRPSASAALSQPSDQASPPGQNNSGGQPATGNSGNPGNGNDNGNGHENGAGNGNGGGNSNGRGNGNGGGNGNGNGNGHGNGNGNGKKP